MTRTDLKRYLASGWIPKAVAGNLLPSVEARRQFARDISKGVYETRLGANGHSHVKADDVLLLIGKTGDELLAELFPPKRLHKGECRQTAGRIVTKAQKDAFERNWHRLHAHFARLIASPYEDVGVRELRLFHQVMALSWRARSFRLCLSASDLHRLTGLDYDYLPKARRRLELWGFLDTSRSGNGGWRYALLDPKTKSPLVEPAQGRHPIYLPSSWTDELTSAVG